jgi:hypothetical protein
LAQNFGIIGIQLLMICILLFANPTAKAAIAVTHEDHIASFAPALAGICLLIEIEFRFFHCFD